MGHSSFSWSYKLWDTETNNFVVSIDVAFDENFTTKSNTPEKSKRIDHTSEIDAANQYYLPTEPVLTTSNSDNEIQPVVKINLKDPQQLQFLEGAPIVFEDL